MTFLKRNSVLNSALLTLALLPLDERPANTRYPAQIAAIAGATLLLPPAEMLCKRRQSADRQVLAQWLTESAPQMDGIAVSVDLIGYGGLVASRISADSVHDILAHIEPLLHVRRPDCPVYGFNVIQRISNANSATEEPDYWATYGMRLYALSRTLDATGISEVANDIPPEIRRDWLSRRTRNHTVNLAMLHAAAQGAFDLLVIPSDDTSPIGLSARERRHLEGQCALLQLAQVLMYPGADDLGSAMIARLINHKRKRRPQVYVHFADPAMAGNIAPYEDRPIEKAVQTQIMAVGAAQTQDFDTADVILFVSPPFERIDGHDPNWRTSDVQARRSILLPQVQQIADWVQAGRQVAVADVAFPNGAEPELIELLFEHVEINKLAAYGGWNTAGNTLGTVLGAACVPQENDRARQIALAHHLLEDWGYQSDVRDQLRASALCQDGAIIDVVAANQFVAEQLQFIAERIQAAGLPCQPQRVCLPWQRTFEVDFEIE